MIKNYIIVILIFLLTACNSIKKVSDFDCKGYYKYIPYDGLSYNYITLQLDCNGTFTYTPEIDELMGYVVLCKKTEGTWIKKNNKLVLNSKCISIDIENNIKLLSSNKNKDSIKIKIVNFSDNTPLDEMYILVFNKKNNIIFEEKTNKDGIIVIPNLPNEGYIPFVTSHVGDGSKIKKLKGGAFYQITYFDCFPEIFKQEKLKIKGDTLIRTIKMKNPLRKFEQKYIKVQN